MRPARWRSTGDLLAGGWPGHALVAPAGGNALPQSRARCGWWPGPGRRCSRRSCRRLPGAATVLSIPAGASARLAAPAPAAGGVPRLAGGVGAGAAGARRRVGHGGGAGQRARDRHRRRCGCGMPGRPGGDELRPRVTALDLAVQGPRTLDDAAALLLPAMSATHLTLPAGPRRTDLALSPGVAAVAGRGADAVTVWTGDTAEARSLPGDWTDLVLLNTGAAPAPASVAWTRRGRRLAMLTPGTVVKRFFGASGSFDMPGDCAGRGAGDAGRGRAGDTRAGGRPGAAWHGHPPRRAGAPDGRARAGSAGGVAGCAGRQSLAGCEAGGAARAVAGRLVGAGDGLLAPGAGAGAAARPHYRPGDPAAG